LPSRPLLFATAAVVAGAVALPYLEVAEAFGFVPLPASFLGAVALIVAAYVATAELAKRWFYRGAAVRS
jgi:Mg2+-importing ATPase